MTRIEHANITVPDIDAAIKFLKIVAPDFEVRKDCTPAGSYRWVHIGNEDYYFALQQPHLDAEPEERLTAYKNYGVNHIGLVVSELQSIESKLLESGYEQSIATPQEHFRKRAYYFDEAGFEWELIEYLSGKTDEKYLYE
ncbi:MAG: VOC family protein [Amphritea sp.]